MSLIIHPDPQGSEGWRQARAGVVTGTGIAKAMAQGRGITRTAYLHRKAHERLTGRYIDEGFRSAYMERGNILEDQARAVYELRTGHKVETTGLIYLNEHRRVAASLDGLVTVPRKRKPKARDGNLEVKCPAIHTHSQYIVGCMARGEAPDEYRKQIQAGMMVTGRVWCDFVSYHPDAYIPYACIRVMRDDDIIREIMDAVIEFITELDVLIEQLRKAT